MAAQATLVAKPLAHPAKTPAESESVTKKQSLPSGTASVLPADAREVPSEHGRDARSGRATNRLAMDFSRIPAVLPVPATQAPAEDSRNARPLPGILQRKLAVGELNDPQEHEADRVAEQVMRMTAPASSVSTTLPRLSRRCEPCEQEEKKPQIQPASAARRADGEAPPIVHDVLRSPGRPLDPAARTFMETRFGQDFGGVGIHADAKAAASARAVNALAYAVGNQLVFGQGQYQPGTTAGRRLLAHELAHVVQQTGSSRAGYPAQAKTASAVSLGTASTGLLVQRTPPSPPPPGGDPLILGTTDPAAETESLFHYGDLTGADSLRSPQGYPRLTDCHIAETVEEAARYTGTPVRDSVKFKYEVKIEREFFLKHFKNVATRNGGFSEYSSDQPIPIKYLRKVGTLLRGPSGGVPSVSPGGGAGAAAEAGAISAPKGGATAPATPAPKLPAPGAKPGQSFASSAEAGAAETPIPAKVPGNVAKGVVEGAEGAAGATAAKAVLRGGLRFLGGFAISFAINLIVGLAYSYLTRKMIEGDITNMLENIPADKQARIQARIDALPSGKKKMARITLEYTMLKSTLGILGGPPAYQWQSVQLIGVHPGNEELDFPSSVEETPGELLPALATQKFTVRISYTVPIDQPQGQEPAHTP